MSAVFGLHFLKKQLYLRYCIIFCSSLILTYNTSAQERYAKILDFENLPQDSRNIIYDGKNYYIVYLQICIDSDGFLLESCGGYIKTNKSGDIEHKNLIRSFKTSPNSIILENDKIFVSGSPYSKYDIPRYFEVQEFSIYNHELLGTYQYKLNDSVEMRYNNLFLKKYANNFILGGGGVSLPDLQAKSIFFKLHNMQEDTLITKQFTLGFSGQSFIIDNHNRIICSFEDHISDKPKIGGYIVKLDSNLNITWRYGIKDIGSIHNPQSCEIDNNTVVMSLEDEVFFNIPSLIAIKEDSTLAWKFRFPDRSSSVRRRLFRLKTASNGDILGVGIYGNTRANKETNIAGVPYVFRMSPNGRLLWEKAFYRTRETLDFCNGFLFDIIEDEEGYLMAVGGIDNYLEYDPVVFQGREDPDILMIRMDSNGCIDDECAFLTNITPKTSNTTEPPQNTSVTLLFPNPSNGLMYIDEPENVSKIEIFDFNGHLIKSIVNPTSDISLLGVRAGLYVAHIYKSKGTKTIQKIVIY